MLCQNCNENEANVKYTQIINGVKKQMNLCNKCADELGIDNIAFNMPINFSNFLGDIFEDTESFMPVFAKPETLLCNKCKTSYDEFIKNGKFGCEECYETFSHKIDVILKNIHGTNRHIGRNGKMLGKTNIDNESKNNNSVKNNKNNKLEELKERLKKEIKEERYEDAAKTRDEIKKLEVRD